VTPIWMVWCYFVVVLVVVALVLVVVAWNRHCHLGAYDLVATLEEMMMHSFRPCFRQMAPDEIRCYIR